MRSCRFRSRAAAIRCARRRITPCWRAAVRSRRSRRRPRLPLFWTWMRRVCRRPAARRASYRAGTLTIDDGDDTSYIAVTVSGGEVLRYYSSCAGGEPALSTDEAVEAAAAFLRARGYDGMRLIDTEDAGQSLICTFCYVQDNVLCTADQLRVRVRLDDGTVCGFSSALYLDTHRARTLPTDTIGIGGRTGGCARGAAGREYAHGISPALWRA